MLFRSTFKRLGKAKSIEPIISVILLIVISIILVVALLSWGKNFTTKSTDKSNDVLGSIKQAVSGQFSSKAIGGNAILLKNLSNEDYNLVGYTIVSSDYNTDYFWINSYQPFQNTTPFLAGSNIVINLICMPEQKFTLELQDISGARYSTTIITLGNTNYTSCNEYNVPLWLFGGTGAYTIEQINISEGELLKNGELENDANWWNLGVNWHYSDKKLFCDGLQTGLIFYPQQYGVFSNSIGKKYRAKFTISDYVSGSIRLFLANNTNGAIRNANGTYIEDLTINLNQYNDNFYFATDADFVGAVSSISITEIQPLPDLKQGTKYLQFTTAGTVSIPSKTAYGTWEFDWFKVGEGNEIKFNFISDGQNGYSTYEKCYCIYIGSTETVRLHTANGSTPQALFYTAENYIKNNTWYRIKVIRSITGIFTVYIKGGSFGDNYVLVSTTGGSGTNPMTNNTYTTSNYFVLNLGAGDRVANIRITPEIN